MSVDISELPKTAIERARHYIRSDEAELKAMLEAIDLEELSQLFEHISADLKFTSAPELPEELSYEATAEAMQALSAKNNTVPSFIGDGLQVYKVHDIVPVVAGMRNLTTAYTPYQPERSQGTLISHWVYQSVLSKLTGFEAVNASLYDRASALFEAICCAIRLKRNTDTVLVCDSLLPMDKEVLLTMAADHSANIEFAPVDAKSGMTSIDALRERITELNGRLAAIVFPQVNAFGLLEDVNALADLAAFHELLSVAVIDPALLATGGLKPPCEFGHNGCDIIVGEAQHFAIGANFGGPGLGLFGVRHNSDVKNHLRATPGRFVGEAKDKQGRACFVQVLSTREQHIRKDKATSNICSNQAFLATLAGASVLAKGEQGMEQSCRAGHDLALSATTEMISQTKLELAFPASAFYNEVVFALPESAASAIDKARKEGVHIGVDVSDRLPGDQENWLKLSFSDVQSEADVEQLIGFFKGAYGASEKTAQIPFVNVPQQLRRDGEVNLPSPGADNVKTFYERLNNLNVSPDDAIYPLGSCTMKYNPYLNDWAANLDGFTQAHPQAPVEDVQGCMEVLYEIQEWFKGVTGLPAVTTQPVAGAQGELVGLKLFQAYHRDRAAEGLPPRDVLLIPKSAHGTNFATAITAGFQNKTVDGMKVGIVLLDADATGRINLEDLDDKIEQYGKRISGIMVTNPNTGGVFESAFKEIADRIHAIDALVYMDGANMNAICGWVNLSAMGVDAVHNNLHKTWSIPHGGGGPGDGIVAVSERLMDYLPGMQIVLSDGLYKPEKAPKSIGTFHRHWGNFAHKVRALTYLKRLGQAGVRQISAYAVLSSRYLNHHLKDAFPMLPKGADAIPRMHEFIVTLNEGEFAKLESVGISPSQAMTNIGKVFLDFGYHAPTVAFPEPLGLMIEPTESYTREELDRFIETVKAIKSLINERPEVFVSAPYFTPVDRVDEVSANRNVVLRSSLQSLPELHENRVDPNVLLEMPVQAVYEKLCNLDGAAV